jgi:PAS domain S-box-containing protein
VNKKNFLSLSLVTPFVMGQLIMAPIAAGLLMLRGIALENPRRKAVLKHAEEALRASEEKLRLIFASMPDSVSVIDMSGKIIDENDAGIRLFGVTSKEQLIGRNGFDFIASSEKNRAIEIMRNIFSKESGGPHEFKMCKVDGIEFDGEVIATLMRDKDGKPQSIMTVIRDITERKRA